ncbi:alpha/beta-hydrolase family protein [uncultured Corynebacterium sp.]|uniref:alpha/beta-hydrolase family protein n=1 Tax=uncultured Corynebacterium sp. TaxID=159447 RepID=UPI0025FB3523|nr:alpha/beta-hydrolase family protein [uncultured Corynebacterium sp.]
MELVRALRPVSRLRAARRREVAARRVTQVASETLPITRRARAWRGIPSNPGLIGAQIASWAAFSPSLMPRPWASTAMVSFGAQITGHVVGVAVGYGYRLADARLRRSRFGRFAPSVRTERIIALTWHGTMSAATAWVWGRSIQHQQTIGALVGMDALSSARAQFGGTAIASGAYLATQGLTFAAEFAFDQLRRVIRPWVPHGVAPVAAGVVVGGGIGLMVDKLVFRRVVERVYRNAHRVNMRVMPGRVQPWEPERSGSPWSLEPWHALGAQGRSMVADGPRARDIAAVMGRGLHEVSEPIRIYAGKVRGRPLKFQTELIVRELHRTGAFRREYLVVHTTTGTGWVPPWGLMAVEFLTLGRCAQVGLQYSDLPSPVAWLTDHETPPAAGRALITRIREEWEKLPEDNRPKLLVAGESLGGFGGNGAFASSADMLASVDGALWTGTPQFTPIQKELTRTRDAGSPEIAPVIDGGRHVRFATRPQELWETFGGEPLGEWEHPRVAYLQHASDPIVWWDYPLAWRRPEWLRRRLGRDVLSAMRWFPVVTFLQVLIDGLVSVDVGDGHGHRYEQESLPAWAAVLGLELDDDHGGAAGVRFTRIAKWARRNLPPKS